jgi:predicted alpha/beta-fold hydrolase
MNLRGCGAGLNYAKKLYHSGRSQDVQEIIDWITTQYPISPITLIGFSLGANLVLKLAGEVGRKLYAAPTLDSVIAVSPPLNLETSVKLLLHKKNKLFNDYFVKRLIKHVKTKNRFTAKLPTDFEKGIKTVFDFDEQITAPQNGFKGAKDYYQQSSSGPYVSSIMLPTLLLHSLDDPFIGNADFYQLPNKDNLDLLLTKKGGHVSWLGKTDQYFNLRWMDRVISKWITWIENKG